MSLGAIVALSVRRRGVVLAVGHSERFNPATAALLAAVEGWRGRTIETRRLNPGSVRITDTSVVADLMVHDLDIVLQIMGRAPSDVVAAGLVQDTGAAGLDHAMALLSFDGTAGGPALAACAASRITAHRARELSLVGDRGTVLVDYLARTVKRIDPGAAEPCAAMADHARDIDDPRAVTSAEQRQERQRGAPGAKDVGLCCRLWPALTFLTP